MAATEVERTRVDSLLDELARVNAELLASRAECAFLIDYYGSEVDPPQQKAKGRQH